MNATMPATHGTADVGPGLLPHQGSSRAHQDCAHPGRRPIAAIREGSSLRRRTRVSLEPTLTRTRGLITPTAEVSTEPGAVPFARTREAIEAHLTIVFAALAGSRAIQDLTGLSIREVLRDLRPLRSATIEAGGVVTDVAPRDPVWQAGAPRRAQKTVIRALSRLARVRLNRHPDASITSQDRRSRSRELEAAPSGSRRIRGPVALATSRDGQFRAPRQPVRNLRGRPCTPLSCQQES